MNETLYSSPILGRDPNGQIATKGNQPDFLHLHIKLHVMWRFQVHTSIGFAIILKKQTDFCPNQWNTL